MYLASIDIDALIREDVPYFDLTGFALGLDAQRARIACFTREDCTVCGTEEAGAVFQRLGLRVDQMISSGVQASAGDELIRGTGPASNVLTAWKVAQNLLDHASGIATKTRRMVDAAREINPGVAVLTTRKIFPGTKALATKAVMAGGAMPHRLGVSETVLVFAQHMALLGGQEQFLATLPELRRSCCEKKILVETDTAQGALIYLRAGADGIQFEKLPSEELKRVCAAIRAEFPAAVLLAAGGINEGNVREYAAADVQGLVTTSLYQAQPVDIGVRITGAA